jgi:hypothetical protein
MWDPWNSSMVDDRIDHFSSLYFSSLLQRSTACRIARRHVFIAISHRVVFGHLVQVKADCFG